MEVGPFLIGKEQVWFPDRVQHGRIEVQGVVRVFSVGQARVIPLLPQEDIHPVILRRCRDGPVRGSAIPGAQQAYVGRRAAGKKCCEHISEAMGVFHWGRSLPWADMAKIGREKTFIKYLL